MKTRMERALTLGQLPRRAAERWADREAIVFGDDRWTFADFDREVDRAAQALVGSGVAVGDKIGLWLTNRPEYLFLFFAIAKIGAIIVPLNTRYRRDDIAYALRQSRCRALVFAERSGPVDYLDMVRSVLDDAEADGERIRSKAFPELHHLITIGHRYGQFGVSWQSLLDRCGSELVDEVKRRAAAVAPTDMAMIVYTSGTTGEAKGVMLSHLGIDRSVVRSQIWGTNFTDVQINYLPLFHLYSIGFVLVPSVALGACQVVTETFVVEEALDLIEKEKVTMIHGFDPHYRELMEAQDRKPRDLSSLRLGSFPSGPDNCVPIVRAAQEKLCPIVASYGLTETWGGTTATFLDGSLEQRAVASGFPLPDVEIRVVDPETGQPQLIGTEGEILIRSPSMMSGYYNKPEETRKAIDAEGWLHTGDAGHIRPDGYIRFTGRYKDMLKVGGENVSPAEVEELLLGLHGVREVAVVGYPDPRLNEVAVAFVTGDPEIDVERVRRHCEGRIASFKIPRKVFVVDELPMTASGKVQKEKLRQRALADATAVPGGEM